MIKTIRVQIIRITAVSIKTTIRITANPVSIPRTRIKRMFLPRLKRNPSLQKRLKNPLRMSLRLNSFLKA